MRKFLSHSKRYGVLKGVTTLHPAQYLRRKQAGEYLKSKFGFGSEKSLAKLAVVGGGPIFHKAANAAIYKPEDLDAWALSKIGAPQKSTSDAAAA
ncbi:MAG: hypothetical protein ACR65T_13205 [Methylocystis sp.]|uniref:hypothetical protein n=1 Tax=Methylocystis sp. TaxID=1911079 RepID=UPI003DA3DCBD